MKAVTYLILIRLSKYSLVCSTIWSGPAEQRSQGVNVFILVLTFVPGAEAQLDKQEHQRPHVHIETRVGRSSTCEGSLQENFQRIPAFQRPASCSRNKGGFSKHSQSGRYEADSEAVPTSVGKLWHVFTARDLTNHQPTYIKLFSSFKSLISSTLNVNLQNELLDINTN